MTKNKRKTRIVRVDAEIWDNARFVMPNESDATISRMMFTNSLFNAENRLKRFDKKIKKKRR